MTKIKTINGTIYDMQSYKSADITVRVTYDKIGKTLSLSDDESIMLCVPMEGLEGILVPDWELEAE